MSNFKKNDVVIIAVFIVISIIIYLLLFFIKKDGKTVTVKQDNAVVYSGGLYEDNKISLEHNTVRIENGKAYMEYSDCKNRICINSGKISKSGETVVCLPNRVIIEIE